MTEYVTPNIHTVLKKYQNSAPKSLQGPGQALSAAAAAAAASVGCSPGSNCPLDVSMSGAGGCGVNSATAELPLSSVSGRTLSPCTAATLSAKAPLNGNSKGTVVPATQSGPSTMALIKKEVLSSPEPPVPALHDHSDSVPLQHPPHTTIKIVPPPPPELSQPVLSSADSGCGELYETRLEGKAIGCFSLGGEMRLCLPQFLNNVLADFTLDQINRIFDELGIFCSQCTPEQLLEFKAAKILPSDVKASGLITRTDAERLCAALLHRSDRNSYVSVEDIPKGAISFKVYHRCFGKCEGICTPDMYSYPKPTCIMCLECKGWFSPQKFVGHVHRKVENRTCHWGFDSRNWHDYLHVAQDVENREKYKKILDELKEVEIKEALKAQHELHYMKRKADLYLDEAMLVTPLGAHLTGLPQPSHQHLLPNGRLRAELLDIPTKKPKSIDEQVAFQQYQRYQMMYAHAAQQRVGQMSAFQPWAPPKAFLHPAALQQYVATLPYLSQEPPVLQNPERVVRNADRERFERTYQPNVALAPRKSILTKEREKEQRELRERDRELRERERERERERIEREREREIERVRERERIREREREREQREQEFQQQQHQHLQHHQHQAQKQQHVAITNLCEAELHIKQERANTPTEMPPSPPLTAAAGVAMDEELLPLERRSNGPLDEEATMPMISPMSLSICQQQQHHKTSSSNSNVDLLQQRRHSLHTSNSSACSTSSSTASTTPPQQQQLLPAHLPPPASTNQQRRTLQRVAMQQQHLRQSPPRTPSPSPTNVRSPEEFSGSNEISSSTSPMPSSNSNSLAQHAQRQQLPQQHQRHQHHTESAEGNSSNNHNHNNNNSIATHAQTSIATVNQHTKLLPASATVAHSSNSSNNSQSNNINNNNEMPSRIRISKNLINQPNIMRSPTPPPPPSTTLQQQHQQQQQFEFYKHNRRFCVPPASLQQQHQQQQQQQRQQLHQQAMCQQQHSPSQSSTVTATAAGLNLSTSASNVIVKQQAASALSHPHQHKQQNGGLPHMGSEFELSTDTDDDSLIGEPDSSNMLAPWELAVDALRDTRPKDRERILQLLQKIWQDSQQLRYQNMQLSELLHNRDAHICELREQLQHYRRQLEATKLQHEQQQQQEQHCGSSSNDGTGLAAKLERSQSDELPLKKSQRRQLETDDPMAFTAIGRVPPAATTAAVTAAPLPNSVVAAMKPPETQQRMTDEREVDSPNKRIKHEHCDDEAKRPRLEKKESTESAMSETSDSSQDSALEAGTAAATVENVGIQNGGIAEDPEESRFSAETDGCSEADDDTDEQANNQNHVQAPHSSALVTPPTATTPTSPDSAATAGQLFDSSNSSDETSMKKAQMSASNALAEISDAAEDEEEHNGAGAADGGANEDGDDEDYDDSDADADGDEDDGDSDDQRDPAAALKQRKQTCAEREQVGGCAGKGVVKARTALPPPPPTKASRKQTPTTTNSEIKIKKELI